MAMKLRPFLAGGWDAHARQFFHGDCEPCGQIVLPGGGYQATGRESKTLQIRQFPRSTRLAPAACVLNPKPQTLNLPSSARLAPAACMLEPKPQTPNPESPQFHETRTPRLRGLEQLARQGRRDPLPTADGKLVGGVVLSWQSRLAGLLHRSG
jgi:hypothetical protein